MAKRSTPIRPKKVFAFIIVIIFLGLGLVYHKLSEPTCTILSNDHPSQMLQKTNAELIKLAHSLGAKDPIETCSGDISGQYSIDGYSAYVIKIAGSGRKELEALSCPVRSLNDGSNKQNANYVRKAYSINDITGYYSGSPTCKGGDLNVILTGQGTGSGEAIYIVYTAR